MKFIIYDETIIMLPLKPQKESQFKLLGGQLYNNFKKMIKDGSMDIEMGQAVAGIKGTIFILEEDGKNSKIKVIEGEVEFTSKANSQKEVINAGETITATDTGLNAKQSFDVDEELKNWPENKFNVVPFLAVIIVIAIIAAMYILRKPKK